MNAIHMKKNPMSDNMEEIRCNVCGGTFTVQIVNCIDTLVWPEGRKFLEDGSFFRPVCPHCHAAPQLEYPCRYLDREAGISIVLIPGIDSQDSGELLPHLHNTVGSILLDGMKHRIVGNFYAMQEQLRICQYRQNDRAIQLLKPLIIGQLQSQGLEVWNGFFTGIHPPQTDDTNEGTLYVSLGQDNENPYAEDLYRFEIHLTNGEILPRYINYTAYKLCTDIVVKNGFAADDRSFCLYDLSWAITVHNSFDQ